MFYDISRYLTDKYFDIVWECHAPWGPPNRPQKSIFSTAHLRVPVFYDIRRYVTDKCFGIVWRCHPPPTVTPPKMGPQKSFFFLTAQLRVRVFYDISRDLTDKYFGVVWECHPRGPTQIDPQKSIF